MFYIYILYLQKQLQQNKQTQNVGFVIINVMLNNSSYKYIKYYIFILYYIILLYKILLMICETNFTMIKDNIKQLKQKPTIAKFQLMVIKSKFKIIYSLSCWSTYVFYRTCYSVCMYIVYSLTFNCINSDLFNVESFAFR